MFASVTSIHCVWELLPLAIEVRLEPNTHVTSNSGGYYTYMFTSGLGMCIGIHTPHVDEQFIVLRRKQELRALCNTHKKVTITDEL